MTKKNRRIEISRRQILAGLGTVGVASAGAGLGTSAYFNDTESFKNNTLAAGELDLKVDWEEHYYDGSSGREYVSYTETDGVGFPDPDDPHVWVPEADISAFMSATALEAFPDPDNDGEQETSADEWVYDACVDGADWPEDQTDFDGPARRTQNEDTIVGEEAQPLVNLADVKPGDFGELTLSFHLCDNPGHVWLQVGDYSGDENGFTEPERLVDTDDEVELLDAIETVVWYDSRGDNVLQTGCDETVYLIDSVAGDGTGSRLFAVEFSGGDANLTALHTATGGNFDQTDAIAATPNGDEIVWYDKNSGHLGTYDIDADTFTDDGAISGDPGGVVLAGYSPSGELWAASQTTNNLYTVDRSGPSVSLEGATGINLQGADLVFDADGTLYIWTATGNQAGLYKVDDPAVDTTADPVDSSNIGNQTARITGLAIRGAGSGQLVGSDRENDAIVEIDRSTGAITDSYPMTLNNEPYAYDFGDMTAGAYCGTVIHRGSLRNTLSMLSDGEHGLALDGIRATEDRECFPTDVNHYIGFAWWLPTSVGNEVQSDVVSFDLGFYAEQCRHNDGTTTPT